jgi:transcriptional regulator with XRE-family HTH domain
MSQVPPYNPSDLMGAQLRAARALLNWSAAELATKSKLGVATIRRAERNDGLVGLTAANADQLVRTLQLAGIIFLPAEGLGPGVRLSRSPQD